MCIRDSSYTTLGPPPPFFSTLSEMHNTSTISVETICTPGTSSSWEDSCEPLITSDTVTSKVSTDTNLTDTTGYYSTAECSQPNNPLTCKTGVLTNTTPVTKTMTTVIKCNSEQCASTSTILTTTLPEIKTDTKSTICQNEDCIQQITTVLTFSETLLTTQTDVTTFIKTSESWKTSKSGIIPFTSEKPKTGTDQHTVPLVSSSTGISLSYTTTSSATLPTLSLFQGDASSVTLKLGTFFAGLMSLISII